jgi:hypothetical protein
MNVSGKTLRRTMTPGELLGKKREVQVKDPVTDLNKLWARHEQNLAAQAEEEAEEGDDDGG